MQQGVEALGVSNGISGATAVGGVLWELLCLAAHFLHLFGFVKGCGSRRICIHCLIVAMLVVTLMFCRIPRQCMFQMFKLFVELAHFGRLCAGQAQVAPDDL